MFLGLLSVPRRIPRPLGYEDLMHDGVDDASMIDDGYSMGPTEFENRRWCPSFFSFLRLLIFSSYYILLAPRVPWLGGKRPSKTPRPNFQNRIAQKPNAAATAPTPAAGWPSFARRRVRAAACIRRGGLNAGRRAVCPRGRVLTGTGGGMGVKSETLERPKGVGGRDRPRGNFVCVAHGEGVARRRRRRRDTGRHDNSMEVDLPLGVALCPRAHFLIPRGPATAQARARGFKRGWMRGAGLIYLGSLVDRIGPLVEAGAHRRPS